MLTYSLLTLVAALPIVEQSPPIVKVPLKLDKIGNRPHITTRETIKQGAHAEGLYYFAELVFGSPFQVQKFLIHTGSSDLSVNSGSSPQHCYDVNNSPTFQRGAIHDELSTGNPPPRDKFWGSDIFSVANRQFRLLFSANTGAPQTQILGLGFPESSEYTKTHVMNRVGTPTYPNFLEMLKQQGIIQRKVFSLWLAGGTHSSSFIIGGLDKNKFYGKLTLVPMVDCHSLAGHGESHQLSVMLHKIRARHEWQTDVNEPVLLNTGSHISYLPSSAYEALCRFLGINPQQQPPTIDCNCNAKLEMNFSGIWIPINVRDLLMHTPHGTCELPIQRGSANAYTLGTTMLRSMYLVFDLESHQVAIAPAINPRNVVGEDIVEVCHGVQNADMAPYYNARYAN